MSARDLFAIFYALIFSAVLSSCWGFSFFQWGFFFRSAQKTLRLFVSISILNLAPATYFAWVYSKLPGLQINGFLDTLSIFLLGLSVFGFYRAYHFLISFQTIRNCLYENEERDTNDQRNKALADRLQRIGPWTGQVAAILFYFGSAWVAWILLNRPPVGEQ